jgi:hypothetical protein
MGFVCFAFEDRARCVSATAAEYLVRQLAWELSVPRFVQELIDAIRARAASDSVSESEAYIELTLEQKRALLEAVNVGDWPAEDAAPLRQLQLALIRDVERPQGPG